MSAVPLDIIVKATAVLAAASAADAVLRRRGSASARHLAWSIAMAAILVLPIASSVLPQVPIRIPVARSTAAASPRVAAGAQLSAASRTFTTALSTTPGATATLEGGVAAVRPGRAASASARLALSVPILIYAAGLLLLLARLVREPLVLRRLARASREMPDPAWQSLLARCARTLNIERPVRLLRSGTDVMPLTFGTRTPTIVLPASADEWSDDRRRAVLLHELAHIERRDCFVQRITAIACACYWPHPGVWWGARRQRLERELACDDRVLAAGAGAREYAGHLLDLAHSLRVVPAPATSLAMARASQLETRLLAVLDAARNRTALHGRALALAIGASMVVVLPVAALRAAVVPFEAPGMPAAVPAETTGPPASAAAQTPEESSGSWEIHQAREAGFVQLTMRTRRGSHGHTIQLSKLGGLSASQIAGSGNVHFDSRREAGTFTFDGTCRGGYCGGVYAFTPNQAFAADLATRGIGTPTPQQQYQLALADVGTALLDELAAQRYKKPDLDTLVRAAQHGVDTEYVHEMAGLGYRVGTVDALVQLRDHGVDPAFTRGLAANGYPHLSADDLVRARDHGADPDYIKGMRDLGYTFDGDLSQLITARDHGIDPEFARALADLGFTKLSFDTLMTSRDHGVGPDYVRGMRDAGYRLSLDDLRQTRDHGVDPDYVRGLAALGYTGIPFGDLITMRDHGVDAAFVRRVQQRGDRHPSVEELIQRRDRGGS